MRARNMQSLTDAIKRRYPGVTIYGIGDDAHKNRVSGHNEDDTAGVRAELQDSDNVPEHRAIDVMLGSNFSKAAAAQLVSNLLSDGNARNRLYYIIYNGSEYSRDRQWTAKSRTDDPHNDHIHISGWADQDENVNPWPSVEGTATPPPPPPPAPIVLRRGSKGEEVRKVQRFFLNVFPIYRQYVSVRRGVPMVVDGEYGAQTEAWVKEFQRRVGISQDGIVGPVTISRMKNYGYR